MSMPSPSRGRRAARAGAEAREHPALDRTDGLSELFGELRLREAAVVRELERLALLVGQLLQRPLHPFPLQTQPCLFVGSAGLLRRLVRVVERVCAAPLLTTHEVDRAPVHEREDPRAGLAALGHEPRRGAPECEKRLLHGILGERFVAQHAQRQAVGGPGVAVVQLAERRLLRARREGDERFVREVRELAGHARGSSRRGGRFTSRPYY
jgi:hypothetical protein